MAEFDPDKFLAEDNIAESKSFDPDEFLSETTPDVKKKEQTKPVQEAPLPGLGGVSEEPTPSPSVGQGVLRDVDQSQTIGEDFIAGVSDLTRTDAIESDVRVTGAGGTFVTKEDAASIVEYEENQKALSEIDKMISGADISKLPVKERMLFGDFESKVSGDLDELKKQRDILAKRSDQLISDTEKDVRRIISSGIGDNWEDFTNELGDIDVSKIGDFARREALNYGLPEDGYFFERVKNAAMAKVEMDKISPTVDAFLLGEGDKKGTYEELYGVKPEDDAEAMLSSEDLRKSLGLSKLDAEFSEQMAQLNRDISRSSNQEIETLSQERYGMPIDEYVSQLGQDYERSVNEVESRYSSLIQDGKFVGSQDQYDAYQQELQYVRSGYESQFNDVVSQNMRDVAAVNNRANRRFNRQRDEILEAYRAEYQDKAKGINPILQDRYQKAYNKALDKAMEEENIKKESRAILMGGLVASGFISGASGQMSSIFRAMGMKEGAEFWEQAAISFDIGDTEIKGWKDILDPKKLVKSTSFTLGGMTPMLAASTGVGLVTGGAGAPATLTTLAAGGAGWGVETMSIVQDSYDQKFKETGSVAKAEDAANKAFNGQVMLMPMYAVEMVPFFGNVSGKLAKLKMNNAATRFLTGGTIETVAELGQEYPQQLIEKAIADDKEISAALDYASVKGFESTVLNVAPTTILLGGAGAAVDTKTSKEDLAKSLAMRINIGELTDTAMEQKILKMTVSEGQEFAKAFVAVQLREGNITEEQANKAASAIESGVATIEKAKEYKLNNENSYILATLDLKLKAAKAKAEAETDPMMKSIAEDRVKAIEKQANQVVKTGNAEVVLVEYPDGDFDILTYDEARTSMTNEEFMKSFVAGDIKFEAMGEGQKKLMSELQEKAKAMEPEAAPAKQKGRLTKFSTPKDGIVGEVTYEDGTKKELTQEEYDALEKQEGLFDVPSEDTQEQKRQKAIDRNERIEKALAILEPIASAREELTVEQLAEVSEVLGEELAGELISDQISKAPDAVDLYNLLDDNKVKIDDTQVTEQERVGTEEQGRKEDTGQVQEPEVGQEEGAADTVLQEQEKVESITDEELDAIDRKLSQEGAVRGIISGRSRKRKVIRSVRNGIKAISNVLPNTSVKVYETQEDYEAATGRKGAGSFDPETNTISINLSSATERAMAHEVFHAFIVNNLPNQKAATEVTKKLYEQLRKTEIGNVKLIDKLEEFADMYRLYEPTLVESPTDELYATVPGLDKNGNEITKNLSKEEYDAYMERVEENEGILDEEKISEYVGIIAENYNSLTAKGKRAVREFVESLLRIITGEYPSTAEFLPSQVSGNEVTDMLRTIGEKVAAGKEIIPEDIKSIQTFEGGETVSDPISSIRESRVGAFELNYIENDKLDKFIKDGLVKTPEDLTEFDGMTGVATYPDDMFSGIMSIDGKEMFEAGGGIFFVLKYGDVWAFGLGSDPKATRKKLNTVVAEMNRKLEENGGRLLIPLVKGRDEKLFSSPSGAKGSVMIAEKLLEKGLISKSDFRNAAFSAIKQVEEKIKKKEKGKTKKKKKTSENLSISGSSDQMISQFNDFFLDKTSSTFELRGDVARGIWEKLASSKSFKENNALISEFLGVKDNVALNASKSGKGMYVVDVVANVMMEPILKGLPQHYVYAVIEVNSPVEIKEDSHESYPLHLVTKDGKSKPILHLPKKRVSVDESLHVISSGNPARAAAQSTAYVKFGPRDQKTKQDNLPPKSQPFAKRDFAPQKDFLFPDEYVFDRPNTQGRFEGRDQKVKVDKSTIKKNVVAAVDFIKKAALKIEDGVTLNIDGTRYDGGGLVVPISSMNVEQGTLKPSTVADFVEMNKGKLSNDTFKLGLYKFPKESTVSIDLSVIVPKENRKLALSVGKKLNQESLFDLDTGENIKTGGTGQNTVELTDEQAAELATSLVENKEPKFLGREQKTKEKKRGFLDRNIEKLKFASNLSESVFENPEAFYEPQVLAEIKENAKYMSDSELIEAMSLDGLNSIMNISGSTNTNMAVLAAAELINRKLAADQDVESVVLQLNKMGTAVGQLMRQFGELKKSTPAGYMLTVERLAEKNNIKLKEADRSKISRLVQAKTDLINDLNEATEKRLDPNLSLDEQKKLDKEIKKISNELYKVDSELNRFVQTKIPLKLTDTLIQIMQGNLLTTASLAVNILGNVSQLSLMFPVKFIASTFDSLRRFLIGGERTTSFSIPAYLYGAKSFVKTLPDAARILFWKGPRDDFNEMLKGEINNGLLGVRAWMVLMSKGGIPEPSKMSGFDKMLSMVSKEAGEKKLGAKANIALNLIIQGTFGVTADIMFRALQAGDIIFKRPYRDMSLYEIGKRKGLSGEKLKNTLKYPSKKELQMADEIAKEGTFQEDSALAMSSKLMTDAIVKAAEYLGSKIFAKNIAKLLARSQFPYVKTPANIASFTFKMNVPAIAFVASMNYLRKGDNRKAALNFGIGVTGSMISTVAIGLVANGLIQSMGDDDDPRERSLKYSTFPPGTINKSALMRVLNYIKEGYDKGGKSEMGERLRQFYVGEIPEEITVPRSGEDEFMSYLKLGIPGFVMGVYAMEDKDTAKKKAVNPAKENFIESMMGGTLKLPQSIKFISQQSFLQGTSALLNALTGSEYETDRWLTNTFRAVSSIPLPNQLASIARAQRDYLPDYRDEDLSVQFKNVMDDKIFFLRKETPSDQIRVDLWGRKIAQTPKGADPYMYHLGLDPLRNTTAREDNLSFEIYELYKRTGDAMSIPSIVDDNFLHTYKGEKRRFNMTVAQTNRLQGIVGLIRQIKAQELVESPRWQVMDDEQRIDELSSIYRDAMKNTMVEKEKKIIAYNIALGLSEDKD